MLRLAHRGDGRHVPENSIAAMEAALAFPACDGLEFDVRLSTDGVPVVTHDPELERVHGRPERVDALTARELGTLGIATLADLLAVVPHRSFLDIELKDRHDRTVVEVIAAGRGPTLVNAVVSSFDADTLERIGRLAPDWPRWLNVDDLEPDTIELAVALGCTAVSADRYAIDDESMARARAAGLEVAAWTVRGRATWLRLERLGVIAACVEGAILAG